MGELQRAPTSLQGRQYDLMSAAASGALMQQALQLGLFMLLLLPWL
jgi:hypothetical protein